MPHLCNYYFLFYIFVLILELKKLRSCTISCEIDNIYALVRGLELKASRFSACIVNGSRNYTTEREVRRTSHNCGVVVPGDHLG